MTKLPYSISQVVFGVLPSIDNLDTYDSAAFYACLLPRKVCLSSGLSGTLH